MNMAYVSPSTNLETSNISEPPLGSTFYNSHRPTNSFMHTRYEGNQNNYGGPTHEVGPMQPVYGGVPQGSQQWPTAQPQGVPRGSQQWPTAQPQGVPQGSQQWPTAQSQGVLQGSQQWPPAELQGVPQGSQQWPPAQPQGVAQGSQQWPPQPQDVAHQACQVGPTHSVDDGAPHAYQAGLFQPLGCGNQPIGPIYNNNPQFNMASANSSYQPEYVNHPPRVNNRQSFIRPIYDNNSSSGRSSPSQARVQKRSRSLRAEAAPWPVQCPIISQTARSVSAAQRRRSAKRSAQIETSLQPAPYPQSAKRATGNTEARTSNRKSNPTQYAKNKPIQPKARMEPLREISYDVKARPINKSPDGTEILFEMTYEGLSYDMNGQCFKRNTTISSRSILAPQSNEAAPSGQSLRPNDVPTNEVGQFNGGEMEPCGEPSKDDVGKLGKVPSNGKYASSSDDTYFSLHNELNPPQAEGSMTFRLVKQPDQSVPLDSSSDDTFYSLSSEDQEKSSLFFYLMKKKNQSDSSSDDTYYSLSNDNTSSTQKEEPPSSNNNSAVPAITVSGDAETETREEGLVLERKWGSYFCSDCNNMFCSRKVWCVKKTNDVFIQKTCNKCNKLVRPQFIKSLEEGLLLEQGGFMRLAFNTIFSEIVNF